MRRSKVATPIPFDAAFDRTQFRRINIWRLGLIPYRNIRQYDPDGDEYYNTPHLYCDFSIDGMPYERFEYAVVANEGEFYDWPLNTDLQIPSETVVLASDDDRGARREWAQPEPGDPAG